VADLIPRNAPAPVQTMMQLIYGEMLTQAVHAAARLGLADLVAKAPATAAELALATKTHAPSLARLLGYLASLGVFAEDATGRYVQTPLSDTLRSDHPQSVRGAAILMGCDLIWKPLGALCDAITTGRPAFEVAFGTTFFDYLSTRPADAAVFNAGMTSMSSLEAQAVVALYDFSPFTRIVDVGGGHGALLSGILTANPKLRGVLFDLPAVVAGATSLPTGPLASRCEIIGGDFFQDVPAGADAYLIRVVLHDWIDDDAVRILASCRRAIRPDGKLILVESVIQPPNRPDLARLNDFTMLALTPGGRERTEPEFRELLRRAGFAMTRVIPTGGITSIVESQPV
jgi:SAM-dependent methyltransferase